MLIVVPETIHFDLCKKIVLRVMNPVFMVRHADHETFCDSTQTYKFGLELTLLFTVSYPQWSEKGIPCALL